MTTPNDGNQAEVAHLRAAILTKTMLCDMLCEDITDLRKRSWAIAAEAWKQRDEARAALAEARKRLAVKCEHPNEAKCAELWQADTNARQLAAVDPQLAKEFPWGCDVVEHLATALLAARKERDAAEKTRVS